MSVAPASPCVAVVIVIADSGPSVLDCVARAMAQPELAECRVVDNASSDGMAAQLLQRWGQDPRFALLAQRHNLGFGPAVNRGAAATRAPYLLVLNPDCLLAAGSLGRLLQGLQTVPAAGVIGALICDPAGQPDPASWRRDPLLARALASLWRRAGHDGVEIRAPWPTGVVRCDAISGALMLLPRAAWDTVGGFDEAYFLHCEDLDLCRRLRDAGYPVLLHGAVRVEHAKGGSSRHRPVFVSWHKHRGMWRWFRRFDPAAQRHWLASLVATGLVLHFLLRLPRGLLAGWRWRRRHG